MRLVTLPPHQMQDLHKIQRGMLRELAEAFTTLDGALSEDLKKAIISLDRKGWNELNVRIIIGRVVTKHWNQVNQHGLRLIKDAEKHVQTYLERLTHYMVTTRTWEPVQPSKVAQWTQPGVMAASTEAILKYVYQRPVVGAPITLGLSERIHAFGVGQAEEVAHRVMRAVREGQGLGYASRELVGQWPYRQISAKSLARGPIGAEVPLPRIIRDIREHINNIGKLTGDELAGKLSQLRRYVRRLKPGGRVGSAYAQLIGDLEKGKKVQHAAVENWCHHKQRYLAERILETEDQGVFRHQQIESTSRLPWLKGYRWHMNRAKHRHFLRSKPGKLKRLGGKHCECEILDGNILGVDEAKQYERGAHPHCACYLEEVWDMDMMLAHPETKEESAWLDRMGFPKAA